MKLHEFFFWLLVFFLPTQLGRHFWPDFSLIFGLRVDYLSPTIYLTDLLVIGILGAWAVEKFKTTKKNTKISCFLFPVFCFLLANCFLAQNQGAALYKFLKIIEFSLLGLYIAKNRISLSIIHHPLSIAVIYSSLIAIAQFINQASLGGLFWFLGERNFNIQTPGIALADLGGRLFLRPYGTFSHPNSMAGFILVSLILIAIGNKQQVTSKILKWLAIGLGFVTIVLSFSRAVWLVGALEGLFVVYNRFAHIGKARFQASLQIGGKAVESLNQEKTPRFRCGEAYKRKFLLFTFYFLLFTIFFVTSLSGISEKPIVERVQLIQASLEMIKSNPILGVGLNNFIVRLPEYWQSGQIRFLQPVHNIYLLILAETGLVGLAIFLWFLFLTFRRLFPVYCLLFAALTAILLLGVFDHYWFTLQQNQLLATIVFGLAWSKIKS